MLLMSWIEILTLKMSFPYQQAPPLWQWFVRSKEQRCLMMIYGLSSKTSTISHQNFILAIIVVKHEKNLKNDPLHFCNKALKMWTQAFVWPDIQYLSFGRDQLGPWQPLAQRLWKDGSCHSYSQPAHGRCRSGPPPGRWQGNGQT